MVFQGLKLTLRPMEQQENIFPNGIPGLNGSSAEWSENVIIADADYVDRVAFNLIVNFERMLMRRVPAADLARWIDCVALDGGMRPVAPSEGRTPTTHVVLLHSKDKVQMDNFRPSHFAQELQGKAFSDNLGEFIITPLTVEDMIGGDELLLDVLHTVCGQKQVKRIMLVPDAENAELVGSIRNVLRQCDDDSKRITVLAMEPLQGGNFRQEILGYSLMSALGISGEELKEQ